MASTQTLGSPQSDLFLSLKAAAAAGAPVSLSDLEDRAAWQARRDAAEQQRREEAAEAHRLRNWADGTVSVAFAKPFGAALEAFRAQAHAPAARYSSPRSSHVMPRGAHTLVCVTYVSPAGPPARRSAAGGQNFNFTLGGLSCTDSLESLLLKLPGGNAVLAHLRSGALRVRGERENGVSSGFLFTSDFSKPMRELHIHSGASFIVSEKFVWFGAEIHVKTLTGAPGGKSACRRKPVRESLRLSTSPSPARHFLRFHCYTAPAQEGFFHFFRMTAVCSQCYHVSIR